MELYYPSLSLLPGSSNTLKRPTSRRSTSIFGGHQSVSRQVACVCREHMVACPGSCHPAQEEWRDEGWLHPWWTSCYSKAAAAATTPVTAKEEGEITTCSRRGCTDNCSRFIITRFHWLDFIPYQQQSPSDRDSPGRFISGSSGLGWGARTGSGGRVAESGQDRTPLTAAHCRLHPVTDCLNDSLGWHITQELSRISSRQREIRRVSESKKRDYRTESSPFHRGCLFQGKPIHRLNSQTFL